MWKKNVNYEKSTLHVFIALNKNTIYDLCKNSLPVDTDFD